ncbi:prostaglandin F synthase 2-like [Hyposmocoma kahamanoa]|uniref:prostaglandin F synthase 2-like n=1 Tax=Hyposmocoma kahamanoa TaxID=1477025 RepID=UPI000E6D6E2C|nr:prostaglandin F synthase 2-like [Hyposmocoma kahamanoa]
MNEKQLRRLCGVARPACLQIEVHALCQQPRLLAAARQLAIPVIAYSPLGSKMLAEVLASKTGREYPDLLQLPVVQRIAAKHSRTPAQILLRHTLQRGVAVIPKSTDPNRIKQNISVWDFELSESEMSELGALDRGEAGRICDFSFFVGMNSHPEFPFKK